LLLGSEDRNPDRHGATQVDTLWLNKNTLYQLSPNGQISNLKLGRHSWYRGRLYPRGTSMKFDENGDVSWDSFYDQFLVRAASGKISDAHIPDILPTAEGAPHSIAFNSTGKLLSGVLAGDQLYDGLLLKGAPYKTTFAASGKLASGTLAKETLINGITYAPLHPIRFGENDHIQSGTLARSYLHGNLRFKAGTTLVLDSSGRMSRGVLATKTNIGRVEIPADSLLQISRNKILTIKSEQPITVDKTQYIGNPFELSDDGSWFNGTLAHDTHINNRLLKAGTWISMTASGKLLRSQFVGLPYHPDTGAVTLLVGPEPVLERPVPTKSSCEQTLDRAMQTRGYWLQYPHIRECALLLTDVE